MSSKKNLFKGKHFILISAILFLNCIGISYAYWNQGLEINASISTADFNPLFLDGYLNGNNEGLGIDVTNDRIRITGKMDEDYPWKKLNYRIQNNSNVPIKIIFPNQDSYKLHQHDVLDLDIDFGETMHYEIICQQVTN